MWHGILGHDEVVEQFRRTLASGRLASTYLFVGPPGVGKRRFAIELAHSLLCTESEEAAARRPCGKCDSCRMFATGGSSGFGIDRFAAGKGDVADRFFLSVSTATTANQTKGLCHRIGMRPFSVAGARLRLLMMPIISESLQLAKCLLKTLEEPPPSALC